jgi:hypothetical protein
LFFGASGGAEICLIFCVKNASFCCLKNVKHIFCGMEKFSGSKLAISAKKTQIFEFLGQI